MRKTIFAIIYLVQKNFWEKKRSIEKDIIKAVPNENMNDIAERFL